MTNPTMSSAELGLHLSTPHRPAPPLPTQSTSTSNKVWGFVNISYFNFNTQVLVKEVTFNDITCSPRLQLRCASGEAPLLIPYGKEPLEFTLDPESTDATPDALLPKLTVSSGLEISFTLDATTLGISGDGDDWFLLHASSNKEVQEILQTLRKDPTSHVKLDNFYPVKPEPTSAKSHKSSSGANLAQNKVLVWLWRWNSLANPTLLQFNGGLKNLCVFIKKAGTEFHVISELSFWTPAANVRSRRPSFSALSSIFSKQPATAPIQGTDATGGSAIPRPNSSNYLCGEAITADELIAAPKFKPQDTYFEMESLGGNSGLEDEDLDTFGSTPYTSVLGNDSANLSTNGGEFNIASGYGFREDDGPVFRATVQHLEKRIHSFKQDIKRILKLGQEAIDSRKETLRHERMFLEAVFCFPSIQPLVSNYLQEASQLVRTAEESCLLQLSHLILDPLRRMYDNDIKVAESKKKQFEQVSDEYYSYLSKYLSARKDKDKKGNFTDAKYQERQKHFELCRFNYYNYIYELRGGGKDQEILSYFTSYAEKQHSIFNQMGEKLSNLQPGLDQIQFRLLEVEKELSSQRKDLDEKRRQIIKPETELCESLFVPNSTSALSSDGTLGNKNKFQGIRDLQTTNRETTLAVGRKREGFLFTSSRNILNGQGKFDKNLPGQNSWHKKWCVLSGGYLHEYNNWKKQLEANFEPVPLQFATVRVAYQTARKFCFEIVTPKLRRQYQAISEEDMLGWTTCIANAIESLWNGTSSCDDLREMSALQDNKLPRSPLGNEMTNRQYLLKQFQIVSTNCQCADCDASNPEWCSINFGILLCIECSGIHRSLGTHITKVRSLTLDVVTFTPDLVEFIMRMGNANANSIWEAQLDENKLFVEQPTGTKWTKPTNNDDRNFKLRFITAKYVERKFVLTTLPHPKLNNELLATITRNLAGVPESLARATGQLFTGLLSDQPTCVLQSIILGAQVDGLLKIDKSSPLIKTFGFRTLITPLHLALFHNIEEPPYYLAELLIQNGANVNVELPNNSSTLLHFAAIHNDLAAIQYLLLKGAQPTLPLSDPESWPCFLVSDLACQQLLFEVTFAEAQKMSLDERFLKLIAPPLPQRHQNSGGNTNRILGGDEYDDPNSPPLVPSTSNNPTAITEEMVIPMTSSPININAERPAELGRSISADTRSPSSPIKRLSGGWKQHFNNNNNQHHTGMVVSSSLPQKEFTPTHGHSMSASHSNYNIPKKSVFRRSGQPQAFNNNNNNINDLSILASSVPTFPPLSMRPNNDLLPSLTRTSPPKPVQVTLETQPQQSTSNNGGELDNMTPILDFLPKRVSKPTRTSSIMEAFRKLSK